MGLSDRCQLFRYRKSSSRSPFLRCKWWRRSWKYLKSRPSKRLWKRRRSRLLKGSFSLSQWSRQYRLPLWSRPWHHRLLRQWHLFRPLHQPLTPPLQSRPMRPQFRPMVHQSRPLALQLLVPQPPMEHQWLAAMEHQWLAAMEVWLVLPQLSEAKASDPRRPTGLRDYKAKHLFSLGQLAKHRCNNILGIQHFFADI